MPYKDVERKREWKQEHRFQRLARRRELRQTEAVRIEAQPESLRQQNGEATILLPLIAGDAALAPYDPKLATGTGGVTLLAAALYKKDWRWWIVGILILAFGLFFPWKSFGPLRRRPRMQQRQLIRGFICLVTTFFAWTTNAQEVSRFEAGPVFAYLRVPDSPPINEQNQAEIGGRFSWNISHQIAIEGEMEASPFRTTNLTTPYQGGHLLQTFVGVKVGKRGDKFGVFGRFRPGFTSYSGVIKEFTTGAAEFGRRTDPAFDIGGSVEFYVSRRLLLRYDLGDTVIHYNSTSVRISGQAVPAPGAVRNNFQFSTGIAFRFS